MSRFLACWLFSLGSQRGPFCQRERGYALPLALMTGVILTILAMTMYARSRTNSLTSLSQYRSGQSLAIAEGGIDRTLARLNQSSTSTLLRVNFSDWLNPENIPLCYTTATVSSILTQGTIGQGTYRVLDYQYNPLTRQGTIWVQGQVGQAVTQIQQTFPIADDPSAFPALLGTINVDLGNNNVFGELPGVDGNVVCTNPQQCSVTCTPDSPPTAAQLRAAVGAGPNSIITGRIFVGNAEVPPLPPVPAGAISIGNINNSQAPLTLPRSTDDPITFTVNGETITAFVYQASSINLSGNDGKYLFLNTKDPHNKVSGSAQVPVYLYIDGNITLSGNASIRTFTDSLPGYVRIYGNAPTSQTFSLNGNTCLNAFVFAPNASMGIQGGGSGGPCDTPAGDYGNPTPQCNITGAVWVKEWDGSNATRPSVCVPPGLRQALGDLAISFESQSGFVEAWQRLEANP
ncbi:DUF7305 domain-containing protein [Thermostichus vulcanus]|uniref:DUF7305 domain-containing protein n=1 Tax=Thermostichus vulcanus str. 'Rupite' TaxID=2813851 RepID=A0ABT0C6X3_THEVL|nr:hypothetical protein [Thermostichus vulcanus]MCJ2541439.1 hypothetical protein [Thermostichus vulcanus str. 'Rupite']